MEVPDSLIAGDSTGPRLTRSLAMPEHLTQPPLDRSPGGRMEVPELPDEEYSDIEQTMEMPEYLNEADSAQRPTLQRINTARNGGSPGMPEPPNKEYFDAGHTIETRQERHSEIPENLRFRLAGGRPPYRPKAPAGSNTTPVRAPARGEIEADGNVKQAVSEQQQQMANQAALAKGTAAAAGQQALLEHVEGYG